MIKNAELVSKSIRNLKRLGDLKYQIQLFQMFNYLIWCDSKMLNWNWSSFWINWLSCFNLVILIDFVKKNWTEKSRFNIKNSNTESFSNREWGWTYGTGSDLVSKCWCWIIELVVKIIKHFLFSLSISGQIVWSVVILWPVLSTYFNYHHSTIWSITLESSIMLLEASFTFQETSFMMFIVQASLTIVTYDSHLRLQMSLIS